MHENLRGKRFLSILVGLCGTEQMLQKALLPGDGPRQQPESNAPSAFWDLGCVAFSCFYSFNRSLPGFYIARPVFQRHDYCNKQTEGLNASFSPLAA